MMHGRRTILAEGLMKNYGKTRALNGLDLEAKEGTVLGLLGPNGAEDHRGPHPGHAPEA